jgi:hypothetical protein
VQKTVKNGTGEHDPIRAGEAIAGALNANVPAFLLLNDLQNLQSTDHIGRFLETLYALINSIKPGVMVLISSDATFFQELMEKNSSIAQRLNRTVRIMPLKDNEASLLIAKRLLAKRIVDEMDPLYPFTKEAIGPMNEHVNGNPRALLKLADAVIDAAVKQRTVHIDDTFVRGALEAQKEIPLAEAVVIMENVEAPAAAKALRDKSSDSDEVIPPENIEAVPPSEDQ